MAESISISYTFFSERKEGKRILFYIGENIIGAQKLRNNYGVINLLPLPIYAILVSVLCFFS